MTPEDLKAWRAQMGLNQRDAAAALGVAAKNYAQLELGKNYSTGKPVTIDRRTALACAALSAGLKPLGEE